MAIEKKNRIRGIRITRAMRQTLMENGMTRDEIENYLYVSTYMVDRNNDDKHLHRSKGKITVLKLINRNSGEIKDVTIS